MFFFSVVNKKTAVRSFFYGMNKHSPSIVCDLINYCSILYIYHREAVKFYKTAKTCYVGQSHGHGSSCYHDGIPNSVFLSRKFVQINIIANVHTIRKINKSISGISKALL